MQDWAFYKKQFPMTVHALENASETGHLAHAYLVSTSNASYREEFPLLLACLRICKHPENGGPCLKCDDCRRILHGTYADYYTLSPTSKSREIVIGDSSDEPDSLRWFESLFYLSSITESGWKIGVIQDADTMNTNAQNAFLKTLEEPPQDCFFILTTGRPYQLLPTIRSRCQQISLTDNHCSYEFPRSADLPGILTELALHPESNLLRTEECAVSLIEMLSSFYEAAQTKIEQQWADRLEEAKNLENAGVKLIERRMEGAAGSEYRRSRELFISLIHAYFAQIVLLLTHGKREEVPNPELLPPEGVAEKSITLKQAWKMEEAAESLLGSLRMNVNDELALRTFCLKINSILEKKKTGKLS